MLLFGIQTSLTKYLSDLGDVDCDAPTGGMVKSSQKRGKNYKNYNHHKGRHLLQSNTTEDDWDQQVFSHTVSVFNILVYGNMAAVAGMVLVYGAQCKQWRRLKKRQWFGMAVGALLYSALAQGLTYVALQQTTVNNVTIISRIEPALIMALSILFLGETVPKRSLVAAAVALCGVFLVFLWPLLEGGGVVVGTGASSTVYICAFSAARVSNRASDNDIVR